MITVTKAPFVLTLIQTIVGIKSKPQTPKGTKFMVDTIFANWPSDPGGKGSNPPGPLEPPRYFGLPMVNPSKPPLPPNRPYR